MKKVIIPRSFVNLSNNVPLIFLAGPIRGAPIWQDEAIGLLFSKTKEDLVVASPRRGIRNGFSGYVVQGNGDGFPRQRAWELHYLERAATGTERKGAIMFWLPGEKEHDCKKAYGAMTRIELGQWMTRYRFESPVRMCIGTDGKFSEIDTIRYDLDVNAPGLRVYDSLEETCSEALRIAGL